MLRKYISLALVAGTLFIAACNTVKGAGEDIQSVGEEGEEVIND